MNPLYLSIIVNSALYIAGLFVAGLVMHNEVAWGGAIATAGACYLAALLQTIPKVPPQFTIISVATTIIIGLTAGVALLIGG